MRRFNWRASAVLLVGFTLAAGACKEDKVALSIDLRTDYVPGREFANVVTEVVPDGGDVISSAHAVSSGEGGFIGGARVADFADLPPGAFTVRVKVIGGDGLMLVQRLAKLSVSSDYALTMVATRNCEGVVCPVPEGDPAAITCSGGKCVNPECSPENPALCPEAECSADADCRADAACVEAFCRSGTCLFLPHDEKCASGLLCDVTRGCHAAEGGDCKPSSPTETSCDDGLDDDCDGKIDCLDPDCDGKACEDGDKCSSGETCSKQTCSGGSQIKCDDSNGCTTDACDPKVGCTHAPKASGACDDGDACTDGDHCEAGKCVATGKAKCDDMNPCTDDTCDPKGGCVHWPNKAPCDDGNPCTEGDTCANSACKAGQPKKCDDGNPCTDDSCDPKLGCVKKNNTATCSDGVFCNGPDTCANGTCVPGSKSPCTMACNEAGKTCVGCAVDGDCGPVTYGAWGECGGFASPCASTGTQSRTVTTPKCSGNTCSNVMTTESQPCTRVTENVPCGDVAYGNWVGCNYTDMCDESAEDSRQVTTPLCQAEQCVPVVTNETMPCSRNTDGLPNCQATVTGQYGNCGGFATQCDTTGTKYRDITTYSCQGGSCVGATTKDPAMCSRTVANGTSCGTGKYCCSGSGCVAENSQNHCSSCGISCGSGSCVGIGSGHYTCTCGSNTQCINDGFGSGATCWDPGLGKGMLCNCQCTTNNCCSGGGDCYKPSGQNYCSY